MRVASFGDIHLGPDSRRDRYKQQEEHLLCFCTALEGEFELIILMGDIYQADYGSSLGAQVDVIREIQRRFPRVTERWRSEKYVYLFGNHDTTASDCVGARDCVRVEKNGFRALYVHGHQFDPMADRLGQ